MWWCPNLIILHGAWDHLRGHPRAERRRQLQKSSLRDHDWKCDWGVWHRGLECFIGFCSCIAADFLAKKSRCTPGRRGKWTQPTFIVVYYTSMISRNRGILYCIQWKLAKNPSHFECPLKTLWTVEPLSPWSWWSLSSSSWLSLWEAAALLRRFFVYFFAKTSRDPLKNEWRLFA